MLWGRLLLLSAREWYWRSSRWQHHLEPDSELNQRCLSRLYRIRVQPGYSLPAWQPTIIVLRSPSAFVNMLSKSIIIMFLALSLLSFGTLTRVAGSKLIADHERLDQTVSSLLVLLERLILEPVLAARLYFLLHPHHIPVRHMWSPIHILHRIRDLPSSCSKAPPKRSWGWNASGMLYFIQHFY